MPRRGSSSQRLGTVAYAAGASGHGGSLWQYGDRSCDARGDVLEMSPPALQYSIFAQGPSWGWLFRESHAAWRQIQLGCKDVGAGSQEVHAAAALRREAAAIPNQRAEVFEAVACALEQVVATAGTSKQTSPLSDM